MHGHQQLALFNAHYDNYCFQPIHIFDGASGKPILSLLRPGKRPSGVEAAAILRHVVRRIRGNWPRVEIIVRGDGHYGTPEVMELLEQQKLRLCSGPAYQRPAERARSALVRGRGKPAGRSRAGTGSAVSSKPAIRPKSRSRLRRVVARVEATAKGSDIRFIVTNLPGRAKPLYEKLYCARGRMENMIKDHKLYTKSDRTSCHRWEANQFRLFLHTGAYWLLHQLRQAAPRRSPWRTATFETLRRGFLKIAVRIEELKSRLKIALPSAYPHQPDFALIARRITALGP